jgi:hypothetical protein
MKLIDKHTKSIVPLQMCITEQARVLFPRNVTGWDICWFKTQTTIPEFRQQTTEDSVLISGILTEIRSTYF